MTETKKTRKPEPAGDRPIISPAPVRATRRGCGLARDGHSRPSAARTPYKNAPGRGKGRSVLPSPVTRPAPVPIKRGSDLSSL